MPDMPYSLLPFDDALQYISDKQDMSEPIRYVLDHLDEWQLIWYGSQRKTYVNWNFRQRNTRGSKAAFSRWIP